MCQLLNSTNEPYQDQKSKISLKLKDLSFDLGFDLLSLRFDITQGVL